MFSPSNGSAPAAPPFPPFASSLSAISFASTAFFRSLSALIRFSIASNTALEFSICCSVFHSPFLVAALRSSLSSSTPVFALRKLRSASLYASSASRRARLFGGRSCTRSRVSRAFSSSIAARASLLTASSLLYSSCLSALAVSLYASVTDLCALTSRNSASSNRSLALVTAWRS